MRKPNPSDAPRIQFAKQARKANIDFRLADRFWPTAVGNACDVGAKLLEVRRRLRDPEKWRHWVRDHFNGTLKDARDCVLIARRWETAKCKKARHGLYDFRAVAKLLRGK
jgi:hypothetical protein